MKLHEIKSWGVDVGNVLIRNASNRAIEQKQLTFKEVVNKLFLVPDALLGLRMLVQKVGPENVWIVSKATREQSAVTRLALERFRFYQTTGLRKDQVLFCPERKDKRPIIKALELEGHVDDRGEVIESIQSFVKCPIWFHPEEKETEEWASKIKYNVRVVSGWKQIMEIF
ncbi:MAG TPA: hypothetical protein VI423_10350 [Paenisporosarcina sp.]|nr:hypothetical protein [Paenisporosarcina sp.]